MRSPIVFPLFAAVLLAPGQVSAAPGEDAAALRAEIARMRADLDRLETRLGAVEAAEEPGAAGGAAASGAAAAPRLADAAPTMPAREPAASGVTIKPRGRLQIDTNVVSRPDGMTAPTLGRSTDVRRAYLGVEGKLGGGFGYRLEADVASGSVQFTDAWLTYDSGPLTLTLGHHRITSLEDVTSDLDTSLLERATFTQAFGMERRLGLSASYGAGDLLVTAGVFADDLDTLGNGGSANSYSLDGRLVYMPKLGGTQLHIGGSLHHRELNDLTPTLRYRARPGARTTEVRFVDTGAFSATAETGYGLEFAAIHGPVHVAAEGFRQRVARPGLPAPTFFGGYGEIGYVFAGGSGRAYKKGVLGSIKPTRGLDKGGAGAWQINLRHDWLDLTDSGIVGGTQRMLGASLVWVPVEHVKFLANYLRVQVRDTPVLAGGRSDYATDVFGLRAQYDF
ncbi:MAG: hypothetical protein BGP16_05215 [Sphingobium sp. 66-54]|nr:MAG: hypothetical protein BGP16_05215 [Sphingobium sp. 66-54]